MKPPDWLKLSLAGEEGRPATTMAVQLDPKVSLSSFSINMKPGSIVTATAVFATGDPENDLIVEYEVGGTLDLNLFRIPER